MNKMKCFSAALVAFFLSATHLCAQDIEKEFDDFAKQQQQEFEDFKIYYRYTPYEQDCVYIENKKVNLQIVFKSNEIVAGLPLILTGY